MNAADTRIHRSRRDATDHDMMHPGIWLGFGDISDMTSGEIRAESFTGSSSLRRSRTEP